MLRAAGLLVAAAAWAAAAPRRPQAAGRFYPSDPAALRALVAGLLSRAAAPELPGPVVALLVPHAGLAYSGPTAARAFRAVRGGRYDDVIVVGTGHYKPLEGAAVYPGQYADAAGAFPYDAALAKAIVAGSPLAAFDASAHEKEHSIEVELPFLRALPGRPKVVALLMNTQDLDAARSVGRAIAAAARGRRVLLVASSDQAHYPPQRVASAVDATTLAALSRLSPAYFWFTNRLLINRGLPDLAVSYCGEGAVTAVLTAAVELGANRFEVLGRSDSGRTVPEADKSSVVGYAAGAFVRAPSPEPPAPLSSRERAALLSLARRAISAALRRGRRVEPALSADAALNLPAAVFVTLRRRGEGSLRGCMGTTRAEAALNEAVAREAVDAAVADARFAPVSAAELAGLSVEVSVLSEARSAGADAIRPGDGVILREGGKRGVFLPEVWKTLEDKTAFLDGLCEQKAGLPRGCWKDPQARLQTFTAQSFSD